jgi:hypothetical protein
MGAVSEVANIEWRFAVNLPPVHGGIAFDRLYTALTHEVQYMVRRRRYEIVLAVRRQQQTKQDEAQAIVQVCLKEQDGICSLVLDIGATKALYEDLSRLMEYLHTEQE